MPRTATNTPRTTTTPSTSTPGRSTRASGTSGAGPTNNSTTAPAATDSVSTLLKVTDADRAAGLKILEKHSRDYQSRGQRPGKRATTNGSSSWQSWEKGAWTRGFIQARQKRPQGAKGSVITVYGAHQYRKAPSTTYNTSQRGKTDAWQHLNLEVQIDGRTVRIPLKKGTGGRAAKITANFGKSPPAKRYESCQKFWISDADIAAAVKKQIPSLKSNSFDDILKKAKFAVQARWVNGHNWGGFNRYGTFKFTKPDGKVASVEADLTFGLPRGRSDLDLIVDIPRSTIKKFPAVFKGVKTPRIASHLEVEGKPQVSLADFLRLYNLMQQVDGPKAQKDAFMQGAFGSEWKDWEGHRVKKYDPPNVNRLDKHGMKRVNAFVDRYFDNEGRACTEAEAVFRIRTVKGERNTKMAQLNFKPGKGKPIGDNVTRRVEYEVWVSSDVADNPDLLRPFLKDLNEQYNPWRAMHDATGIKAESKGGVTGATSIGQNRRFKFEFEKKRGTNRGVAFEASIDLCLTLPLDTKTGLPIRVTKDGRESTRGSYFAMSCFAQLEPEANHMALNGPAASQAPAPPASGGKPKVYLHGPDDVSSSAFDKDPSFKQFGKTWMGMQSFLFPGGKPKKGHQKNAAGQMIAGTVSMNATEKKQYARELAATNMLRESASKVLEPAFDKAYADYEKAEAQLALDTRAGSAKAQEKFIAAKAKIHQAVRTALEQINPLDHIDLAKL